MQLVGGTAFAAANPDAVATMSIAVIVQVRSRYDFRVSDSDRRDRMDTGNMFLKTALSAAIRADVPLAQGFGPIPGLSIFHWSTGD
jgi:hypothetical protein